MWRNIECYTVYPLVIRLFSGDRIFGKIQTLEEPRAIIVTSASRRLRATVFFLKNILFSSTNSFSEIMPIINNTLHLQKKAMVKFLANSVLFLTLDFFIKNVSLLLKLLFAENVSLLFEILKNPDKSQKSSIAHSEVSNEISRRFFCFLSVPVVQTFELYNHTKHWKVMRSLDVDLNFIEVLHNSFRRNHRNLMIFFFQLGQKSPRNIILLTLRLNKVVDKCYNKKKKKQDTQAMNDKVRKDWREQILPRSSFSKSIPQ